MGKLSGAIAGLMGLFSTNAAVSGVILKESITPIEIDRIMMVQPRAPQGWDPKIFTDIAYPWPEKYINAFQQPFNSYAFNRNAAALVHLSRNNDKKDIIKRIAAFLDFSASQYTVISGECVYITNDFEFGYLWSRFQKGFRGAFMNAVTAYGYIQLYEATLNDSYLRKAHILLWSAALCETEEVKLHNIDGNGFYWLNEYVFKIPEEDEDLFFEIGFEKGQDGWWRARVYNGHIHALLAFIRYRVTTRSEEFDDIIEMSLDTMRHYLPLQRYEDKFFSYMAEYPQHPDYGPWRATHLAEGLCNLTNDQSICETSSALKAFYEQNIKGQDEEIYRSGVKESKKIIQSLKEKLSSTN
nr:hypothetical protein [Brucella intermedia]